MPIKLKLIEAIAGGFWKASGTFSGRIRHGDECSGRASILLKVTDEGLLPVLDQSIFEAKLFGASITKIDNAYPVAIEKIRKGATLSFSNISFTL